VGDVIAGRFMLEALAGVGGMGNVYRARDSALGQGVALKLLHPFASADALQRFSREAAVLSALRHPGIVAYVAHGQTEQGQPFLAMEWLEGEDLARRLARQPLSLEEALALVRRTAQALAVAHQQGVIHRDLKPSNLFLRQGRPEDAVLLDFGLARHTMSAPAMTASHMVLGTPGYMAPEQVSGQSHPTPAADIFSLGCILYECLTGQSPFSAPHLAASLAKILFAEPRRLREVRPELPRELEEVVEQMLAKEPARRFPDASSLLARLVARQAHWRPGAGATASPGTPAPRLAGAEQQLVTVLLAAPRAMSAQAQAARDSQQTLRDSLRGLLAPHGARAELLADGTLVLILGASLGSATDPAALAARCALSLLERWPEALVVLTTGRGSFDPHLPVGEAMDRAGQLLRQLEGLPVDATAVLLDEVTAGLLGPGFRLTRSPSGFFLLEGEHLGSDESRPLLGRPTPCVGREQELALLEMTFSTCVEESTAQAILVTAPAGVGKSRLRHEFLRRIQQRHTPPALVLVGRGDPMSAGSADGLLGQALRRLCGISGGEPLEERRTRLSQRVSQHLPAAQAPEVVEFLGELCAIPFPEEHSPRLRAARGDPQMMSIQVGRALVAFLAAECARQPVVLVLEDLHWGDLLSVRLMDEALRSLAEQPFLVLALARPEVEQLLPGTWTQRLQQVPLRGLSRKAGGRLVREVLGAEVPDALIDRLMEQAAGNALFLEELIRAVAEGRGEEAPETVLAMLQARLGRLEPEARQVLLAASYFGRTFWLNGVGTLLGGESASGSPRHWLQHLVEQEWVERQEVSRFPGEEAYRFRHALVRDAAYGLVPGSYKPEGHQRVGAWLEEAGESDPQVLAEHALLGQQSGRAIQFLLRAAELHLERHDMSGTLRCVKSALGLSPQGPERVPLHALQATVSFWLGDFPTLFEQGPGALARLSPGSRLWCQLWCALYMGHVYTGGKEQAAALGQQLLATRPETAARLAYVEGLGSMFYFLSLYDGDRQESSAILARVAELCAESSPTARLESAWSTWAHGFFSFLFEARPWQVCARMEPGCREFFDVGLERSALGMDIMWAQALEALGDRARAEVRFRENVALCERLGLHASALYARFLLVLFLSGSPEPRQREEALALAAIPGIEGVDFYVGLADTAKARVAAAGGDLTEAEARAREACKRLAPIFFFQLLARTQLARVLLAQGRAAEAREVAAQGVQRLEQSGSEGTGAVGLRLALAEAYLAEGDTQAGEAALRRALQCVRTRAGDIPEAVARERFLHAVPENARVLELARQRWGGTEVP
jgi:tetratricopeptide (TPR) repeat protein